MIVGQFSSGVLLNAFGWNAVLWGSLVPGGVVALLTLLSAPLIPIPLLASPGSAAAQAVFAFSAAHC